MEFLGIGPTELIAILLIVFLVMGPQDMAKMGATLGRTLRSLRQSEIWRAIQDAGRQLRNLPDTLAKETGMDELKQTGQELKNEMQNQTSGLKNLDSQITAWTRSPEPLSQKDKPIEELKPPEDKPEGEQS